MGIVTDVQRVGADERTIDNIERRALKSMEELGEMAEAVLSATSVSGGKAKTYLDIVEEACDVVIMGLDVALTKPPIEMDDDMWRAIVKKIIGLKLEKWKKQIERKGTLLAKLEQVRFDVDELQPLIPDEDEIQPPGPSVMSNGD